MQNIYIYKLYINRCDHYSNLKLSLSIYSQKMGSMSNVTELPDVWPTLYILTWIPCGTYPKVHIYIYIILYICGPVPNVGPSLERAWASTVKWDLTQPSFSECAAHESHATDRKEAKQGGGCQPTLPPEMPKWVAVHQIWNHHAQWRGVTAIYHKCTTPRHPTKTKYLH